MSKKKKIGCSFNNYGLFHFLCCFPPCFSCAAFIACKMHLLHGHPLAVKRCFRSIKEIEA